MTDPSMADQKLIEENALLTQQILDLEQSDAARKRGEESLRRERHRAQGYLDTVETMIVALDVEGRITTINRKGCQLLGWSEQELIGQFWFGVCLPQPDGVEKVYPFFQTLMAGEIETNEYFENPVLTRSGEIREIAWHNALLRDDNGRAVGSLSSGGDVTERKQAERAFQESAAKYKALIEGLPDIVTRRDRNGRILFISANVQDMMNMTPEQFIGKTSRELGFPEEHCRFVENALQTVLDTDAPLEVEFTVMGARGPVVVSSRLMPERDAQGLVQSVLSIARDVTAQRQTEEALRESEARHRTILQTAMDGFWLVDTEGRLLDVNETYCRMSGYSAHELLTMRIPDLDAVESAADTAAHIQKIMANGEDRFESRHKRKDGSTFDVEASVQYRQAEGGRFAVFVRDVTERKREAAALTSSNVRLEALWNLSSLPDADVKTASDHLLASIVPMTESAYGFYGLVNEDESVMTIHAWSGEAMRNCSMADKPQDFPVREAGVWAEAIRRRAPLILNDYAAAHEGKRGLPEGHAPLTNLLVVPIFSHSRITAVAAVANRAIPYGPDDVQQITAFLSGIQAIMDRKRAEAALLESEERFRRVFEKGPLGMVMADVSEGRFTAANAVFCEMLGYTAEELKRLSFADVTHPDHRSRDVEAV